MDSCAQIGKGEKILIEARGIDYQLVTAIVEEVYKAGGFPFVSMEDMRVSRAIRMGMTVLGRLDSSLNARIDAMICRAISGVSPWKVAKLHSNTMLSWPVSQ